MRLPSPPWLPYESIRSEVDNFLAEYWPEGNSPIDVEKIVDARMGIHIIDVGGLKDDIGVDGFLSRDGKTIYVDRNVADNVPNRYRFTLAHELGHLRLHRALYAAASFDSPAEWLRMQSALPPKDYSRYEFQAYDFGGLLLVPGHHLRSAVDEACALAARQGYNVDLQNEADVNHVASWVAKQLRVSAPVVMKRGKSDGLWDV